MSEQTEPIEPASTPPAESAVPTAQAAAPAPIARRSVTLPLLPLAIVGGVIVALLFFGGGVALGYGVAAHDGRPSIMQPHRGGPDGANGPGFGDRNGNGFGPNQGGQGGQNQNGQNQNGPNGQNGQNRPGDRSTPAPKNG